MAGKQRRGIVRAPKDPVQRPKGSDNRYVTNDGHVIATSRTDHHGVSNEDADVCVRKPANGDHFQKGATNFIKTVQITHGANGNSQGTFFDDGIVFLQQGRVITTSYSGSKWCGAGNESGSTHGTGFSQHWSRGVVSQVYQEQAWGYQSGARNILVENTRPMRTTDRTAHNANPNAGFTPNCYGWLVAEGDTYLHEGLNISAGSSPCAHQVQPWSCDHEGHVGEDKAEIICRDNIKFSAKRVNQITRGAPYCKTKGSQHLAWRTEVSAGSQKRIENEKKGVTTYVVDQKLLTSVVQPYDETTGAVDGFLKLVGLFGGAADPAVIKVMCESCGGTATWSVRVFPVYKIDITIGAEVAKQAQAKVQTVVDIITDIARYFEVIGPDVRFEWKAPKLSGGFAGEFVCTQGKSTVHYKWNLKATFDPLIGVAVIVETPVIELLGSLLGVIGKYGGKGASWVLQKLRIVKATLSGSITLSLGLEGALGVDDANQANGSITGKLAVEPACQLTVSALDGFAEGQLGARMPVSVTCQLSVNRKRTRTAPHLISGEVKGGVQVIFFGGVKFADLEVPALEWAPTQLKWESKKYTFGCWGA